MEVIRKWNRCPPVEEHAEIGRPFQCAGMVNPSAMERIGAYDTVLTRIWGARMYSPSGTEIVIGTQIQPELGRFVVNCLMKEWSNLQ